MSRPASRWNRNAVLTAPSAGTTVADIMNVDSTPMCWATRVAWSLFRCPVRSRQFPARNERLITASERLRYGV